MRVNSHGQRRKFYKMSEFRGVDYSSSPLEVKPYRATDMANLILKDGTLHKRTGWEHLADIPKEEDVDPLYKAFIFKDKILILTRKHAYWYDASTMTKSGAATLSYNCEDNVSAIENEDKLYIYTGKGIYIFDGTTLTKFTRKNAYIPSTTINIPRNEITGVTIGNGEADFSNAEVITQDVPNPYTSNEPINLMTPFRKNKLIYSKPNSEAYANYYKVDGRLELSNFGTEDDPDYAPKLKVSNEIGYTEYEFVEAENYWENSDTGIRMGVLASCCGISIDSKNLTKELSEFVVWVPNNFSKDWDGYEIEVIYGSVDSINDDYIPEVDGVINRISNCTISTMFGVDGGDDRIFLSGASMNKNIVFYSENKISGNPDPTYFPVTHQIVCGDANAPITAFMRISDGTLAVFKDVSATKDVSVYYLSGYYSSVGEGLEGNLYYQAIFNVKAGSIKQNGVSPTSISNFEGDSIFASQEGVYGIQLSSNIASGERYAKERSRVINAKLTQFNLRKACGISHNGKYYLAVGGDKDEVYVADSRHKYKIKGDSEDGFNYEWCRWTGVPAIEWFLYNNELYFIAKYGWICRMTNEYSDIFTVTAEDYELVVLDQEMLESNGHGTWDGSWRVAFIEEHLPLIQKAVYAIDEQGNRWEIKNIKKYQVTASAFWEDGYYWAFDVPSGITPDHWDLQLTFYLAINSYWESAVIDLENSMYKKNLWALSTTVIPTENGVVKVGYKTRSNEQLKARVNKQVEGAYVFNFDNIDFSMFSFDCGGFVNSFRQKVFERGFVYLQLAFGSDSIGDCIVTEMAVEYSPTIKNIGVG